MFQRIRYMQVTNLQVYHMQNQYPRQSPHAHAVQVLYKNWGTHFYIAVTCIRSVDNQSSVVKNFLQFTGFYQNAGSHF